MSWYRHRLRLAISAIAVTLPGTMISCTAAKDPHPVPEQADAGFVISYAGAADRLDGLGPVEVEDQLRDWARTGLAARLGLDTDAWRDAAYDTLPVRDGGFDDLSRQVVGPGRMLLDGAGVLHLLVPQDDPHQARAIGSLLDQHDVDAGGDAERVRVHHYRIHSDTRSIQVVSDEPASTAEVRGANGYVTMRIDTTEGLTGFLARTTSLSGFELRGSEVWADGWTWPAPGTLLDHEDVSVLQRGYSRSSQANSPGFSLDPGPVRTVEDLLALVPGLSPDLAGRILADRWDGSAFDSAAELMEFTRNALLGYPQPTPPPEQGLPSDPTRLFVLASLLSGGSPYAQARYEGLLKGTEIGMTLFYTDNVAKDWVRGVGAGVPTEEVAGFGEAIGAEIPWSQCTESSEPQSESGRLWFGQNESAFAFGDNRLGIGAQATRLFARSDGHDGTEIERSFIAGKGLRWWDHHYRAVADHEPQFERLDQIMRWSGALEWLASTTTVTLPQLDDPSIRSDLLFQDWFARNDRLRERGALVFVTPPSATDEGVLTHPSAPAPFCGLRRISGGVSLGDLVARKDGRSFRAELPGPMRRAGLYDEKSAFDGESGTGRITQVSVDSEGKATAGVEYTLSRSTTGDAIVETTAPPRRDSPLGALKDLNAASGPRKIRTELSTDGGTLSQRVTYQSHDLGRVTARRDGDLVSIQWNRGPVGRMVHALESFQIATGLPAGDSVLCSFRDTAGRILHRLGGLGEWLSITGGLRPSGTGFALRRGAPHPDTGRPDFGLGTLTDGPDLSGTGWVRHTPATAADPAWIEPTTRPTASATSVRVTRPDGGSTIMYVENDRPTVAADDPLLGPDGTPEGAAMLRSYPLVSNAMREAERAGDGLLRGIVLGRDGVALVGAGEVFVAGNDHPWAAAVHRAAGPELAGPAPLMRIDGDHVLHVDLSELTAAPGSQWRRMNLDELRQLDAVPYVNSNWYSAAAAEHGTTLANFLPRDEMVRVRAVVSANRPSSHADIRVHQGTEWRRVGGFGLGDGGPATGFPGGPAANPTGATATAVVVTAVPQEARPYIVLICPDSEDEHGDVSGCGS
jgi:hypothetical protein